MGARSIYLRVAELLRAQHAPIEAELHRHSGIALWLRASVIDAGIRMDARLQYLQAWAALHSHPATNVETAAESMQALYLDALNEMPYLTGGKSGSELQQSERMAAMDRYRAWRDKVIKPGTKRVDKLPRPAPATKHKSVPV